MLVEMANPKEEWLSEYSKPSTKHKHEMNFDLFCKWASVNDVELVEEYNATDPRNFSKKWGKRIIQYYNGMIEAGAKINTARTRTNAPRAFFKSQCIAVKIKRGAIGKARMAYGEHEFLLEEFQKMFRVGNIEDKARLSTAICLGWGAGDVAHLEWSFIEPYLDETLEPPIAFWYERAKTGAPSRSHLTHEALSALRELRRISPEAKYIFGSCLTVVGLNKWLKSLVRRAKIKTRGKIRFHLLRKFAFSQLSASGMNQWEAKICIGKSVPTDILTYLKAQEENLRNKFMVAESRLTISGVTNGNYIKFGEVAERMEMLEGIVRDQAKEKRSQDIKIEVLTDEVTKQQEFVQGLFEIVAKLQNKLAKK